MTDTLMDLIERVEKATPELQGKLIDEAWEACAEDSAAFRRFACAHSSGFGTNAGRFSAALEARAFESAAIMLVPEGFIFGCGPKDATKTAWAWASPDGPLEYRSISNAATPALALCAAALRAHQENPNDA